MGSHLSEGQSAKARTGNGGQALRPHFHNFMNNFFMKGERARDPKSLFLEFTTSTIFLHDGEFVFQ